MPDPYACLNCAYEMNEQWGGPDPDNSFCEACEGGNNFSNIDLHGAHASGKGRFLAG